jgi:hypothetical protein
MSSGNLRGFPNEHSWWLAPFLDYSRSQCIIIRKGFDQLAEIRRIMIIGFSVLDEQGPAAQTVG